MILPILWFVKITGLPLQYFYYRKKIYTENGDKSLKKIKGGALIISNHTSVYDYPLIMYTFLRRSLRTLVAEVMYNKGRAMSFLLKSMGCIRVDRDSHDFAFISEMVSCLRKGQVGLVFPEGRIPEGEEGMLPFKPSYVVMALEGGVPIIPVYTNGVYGKLKKQKGTTAKLMIGKPIFTADLIDPDADEKENIGRINEYVKNRIKELAALIDEQQREENTEDRQTV